MSEMRAALLEVVQALELTGDLSDDRADVVRDWIVVAPGDDLLMCFDKPKTLSGSPWVGFKVGYDDGTDD